MSRRDKILLAGLILLTFCVVVLFVYSFFFSGRDGSGSVINPTPTPPADTQPFLTPSPDVGTAPPLEYEPGSGARVIEALEGRDSISDTDQGIRSALVSQLGGSGVIFSTENVRVEYIQSADVFHGAIVSPNISIAKNEAVSFFTNQGMSQDGVCKLPIIFYVERPIAEQLGETGVTFSPLLDEC